MKVVYKWNGKTISQAEFRKRKPMRRGSGAPMVSKSYARPLESVGLACSKRQVGEFNALYADAGISGAYHRPDGTCVFESRRARNDVLRLRGVRDNDAGYGDYAGRS